MSSEISDTELKSELESFGATVGKINEKNRAILIKKLNHFRARVAMNEKKKASEKKRTNTRRGTSNKNDFKTNDVEEELVYSGGRSLRSRQINLELNDSAANNRRNKSSFNFSFDNSLTNYRQRSATGRNSSHILTDYSDNESDLVDVQSIGINTSFPSPNDSILSDYTSPSKKFSHSTPIFSKPQKIFDHQINRIESIPIQKFFSFSKLVFGGILVLFFAIIITYFYKSGTPSFPALEMPVSSKEVCIKLSQNKKVCLQTIEYRALKDLVTHVAYKTGEAICNGKNVDGRVVVRDGEGIPDGWVSTDQVIKYLRNYYDNVGKTPKHEVDVTKLFGVIMQRADWNITVACRSGAREKCVEGNVVRLLSTRPAMKLWCRIKRTVDKLVFRAIILVSGLVGLVWLVVAVKWCRNRKLEENKKVANMVKQIIELLKQHLEHSPKKDFIPACDVRDFIIQPQERSQMRHIWNRALKEIRNNEPQVQQDVVYIDGEETFVWKWIKPQNGLGVKRRNLNEGISNVISSAHLKILNILPSNHTGEVPTEVRDAILDKCGQYHGILHIGCDPSFEKGTVYIKCVSEAAATQNFKALHAWSYLDRLVSVRQVSGVVYNMMFEDSVDCMVPLKSTVQRRRSFERSNR